jgi:hypothetical protein
MQQESGQKCNEIPRREGVLGVSLLGVLYQRSIERSGTNFTKNPLRGEGLRV